jgi:uncharacterized membrane protein YbhN (UPF0104 family)
VLLVTVIAVEYAAVHLLAGAHGSWPSLGGATPVLIVAALAAELASLACFSRLTLVLLTGPRPPYLSVLAIDVTGNGFSHVAPGGGASAAVLRLGLFSRAGVDRLEAVGAAAVQYAVTLVWMVAVLLLGLVAAVPSPSTEPIVRTVAVMAAVLVTAAGGLVAVLMARPDQVVAVTHALAKHLPLVPPLVLEGMARTLVAQVGLLARSPRTNRRALLWAMAYWSCDALSLHLSLWAFGDPPGPGALLTTYALVSLLALLPLTPGGLGLVEGVGVPLLVSFGTPHDTALLGVLTWRLFGFWLTIPLALAAYVWLRTARQPTRTTAAPATRPDATSSSAASTHSKS